MFAKIKQQFTKISNSLKPSETLPESKEKWDALAKKNARYFVLSNQGEQITEEAFAEAGKEDFEQLIADDLLLKQSLGDWKKAKVLEIGCGLGRITGPISEHFGEVTGIDISEEMIRRAKERLAGRKNVRLMTGDGKTYPVTSAYFDLVFSFIVFQHMPDEATVKANLVEICRVLKPGGLAKIQLRGVPVKKGEWFYGPSFDHGKVQKLLRGLPIKLIQESGEGERYHWITFCKDADL